MIVDAAVADVIEVVCEMAKLEARGDDDRKGEWRKPSKRWWRGIL